MSSPHFYFTWDGRFMGNGLEKRQSVLGDLSVRLLSYVQMKGKTIARIGDFTRILGKSKNQERNLLSRGLLNQDL